MFGGYKDRRVLYRGRKLYHNLSLPLFQSTWGLRGVPKGWRGIAEIYTDGLDLYMPKVLLGKREELDYVVQGDSNQGYGLARKEVAYV